VLDLLRSGAPTNGDAVVSAQDQRGVEKAHFVDDAGLEGRRQHPAAALDQDAGDTHRAQLVDQRAHIDPPLAGRGLDHPHALSGDAAFGLIRHPAPGNHQRVGRGGVVQYPGGRSDP